MPRKHRTLAEIVHFYLSPMPYTSKPGRIWADTMDKTTMSNIFRNAIKQRHTRAITNDMVTKMERWMQQHHNHTKQAV